MNAVNHNNVVIFDDRGIPSIMCRFVRPKDAEEVPAVFKIGDKVADAIYISKYPNTVIDGRAYSMPMADPTANITFAPNFSTDSEVAAIMAAKAENINGLFTGKAIIDADTKTVKAYSDVPAWKNNNNITQPSQLVTWPKYTLGGKIYHSSVHQAGVMSKTDATEDLGGGSPCESASNKTIQIDGMALADGTEVLLDLVKANYLNSNGIITALNLTGSFVSWGNETACYPANTDVTDYFYCVSRMFSWVANSVILSMWSKVDKKLNKRLIESVTQSINIWLNGLMAEEKILGGRVEFLEEENTTADLLAGKAKFHIYLTPPSPAKELDFVLEYDVSYLENIFA